MLNKKIWILSLIVISGLYAESNTTVNTDTNKTVADSSVETNTTTAPVTKSKNKTEKKKATSEKKKTTSEKKDYSGVEEEEGRDIGSLQDIKNKLQTTPTNIEKSKYNFVGDR